MASIHDDIKQKDFGSPYNELVVNTLYTSSWLTGQLNQVFKPHNITVQQFNVLRILRGQHPSSASVNLIKERMIDKMSNVSRIVERLKSKDLVDRKQCKHDRRQVDVTITKKGLDVLSALDVQMKELEEGYSTITPEQAAQISKMLDQWRG